MLIAPMQGTAGLWNVLCQGSYNHSSLFHGKGYCLARNVWEIDIVMILVKLLPVSEEGRNIAPVEFRPMVSNGMLYPKDNWRNELGPIAQ